MWRSGRAAGGLNARVLRAGEPPGAGVLAVVAQQVLHEARGAGLAVAQLQQGAPMPDGGQAQHHRGDGQREAASLWDLCSHSATVVPFHTISRLPVSGARLTQTLTSHSVQHCGEPLDST